MRQTGISLLLCFCLQGILLCSLFAQQNVGIGTASPHPSAKLEVQSTNQGLLVPRLTLAQRNSIASPAAGLQIYNTTDNSLDFFDGTNWLRSFGIKEAGQGEIADGWTARNAMVNNRRNGATFTIGNKVYLGGGDTASNAFSDSFTEYDVLLNTWRRLPNSNLPDGSRWYPFSFAIGQKGYVGGGISSTSGFTGSLWEFDPVAEMWTAKASFPEQLIGSSAVVVNGKAYVGLGRPESGSLYSNAWYEFDPATNSWTSKTPFPGQGRWLAQVFAINNKVILVGGEVPGNARLKDVWEYDPATNVWLQKNDFLGNGRAGGVGFAINNRGYVGYGIGTGNTQDFFEYNANFDTWSPRAQIAGAGGNIVSRGVAVADGVGLVFGGFGNNLTTFRYQPAIAAPVFTPGGPTASAYINNGIWAKVGETVYNLNSGNIGIGTTTPQAMLEVAGDLQASNYRLATGAASGKMLVAADATGTFGWQDQPWVVGANNTVLKPTGFVGIGENAPTAPLHITGGNLWPLHVNGTVGGATAIRMTNSTLPSTTWDLSLAGSSSTLTPAGSFSLRRNSETTFSLTVTANRFVGIGVNNPLAPLHVAGNSANTSATAMRYFNFASAGITAEPAWTGSTTVYAEGNICATQAFISAQSFNFSDARIKQIIGASNNEQDLERLRKIEVTRYRYIDTLANGSAVQTKVIAQQLKDVMPEAVSYRAQFIPSIMQLATGSHYNATTGELTLIVSKLPALPVNASVKCFAENGTEILYTLVAAHAQQLVLKGPQLSGRLFVYGHEVPDFHVVDYDAINLLNVSATQALLKRIEALEAAVKNMQH